MKIPHNFKLFNKHWTIRPSGFSEMPDEMGMCYPNNLEIAYQTNYPLDEIEHVILHEMVHAIETTLQLELTERQVDLMALGLLDLIKNNQHIVDFLRGEDDAKTA